MAISELYITRVGLEHFDAALLLLERFFLEEGFQAESDMRVSLKFMLQDDNSAVFLAIGNGEELGVATVSTTVGIEYGRSAELDDLYVLPGARGRGLANQLIEAACVWAAAHGCSSILATVTPGGDENHKLIEFYSHHGFFNTGRLIMERPLGSKDD